MDNYESQILKECIDEIKNLSHEQSKLVFKYFLKIYIRCIMNFGKDHKITKEVIKLWKSMVKIRKEEKNINSFILKNSKIINFTPATSFLDLLEHINSETVENYYKYLEDIETACDLKNEIYAKHRKKDFKTLIETDEYRLIATSMTIGVEDIKKFLNYPEEFWEYIKDKITYVDYNPSDWNEQNMDFNIVLPHVIDYLTVKTCITQLGLAYSLFMLKTKEKGEKLIPDEEQINQFILKKYNKRKKD